MDWHGDIFGKNGQLIVAGIAGGLVRWLTLRESWRSLLPTLLVGALTSLYLGPHFTNWLSPILGAITPSGTSEDTLGGFLAGVVGIGLTGLIIDFWNVRRGKITPSETDKGPTT